MRRVFARKLVLLLTFFLMGLGFYACSGGGGGAPGQQQQPDVSALTQTNQATPPGTKSEGDKVDADVVLQRYAKHVDQDYTFIKAEAARFNVIELIGKKNMVDSAEIVRVANFIANTDHAVKYVMMYGIKIYDRIVYTFHPSAAGVTTDITATATGTDGAATSRVVTGNRNMLDRSVSDLIAFSSVLQRLVTQDLGILEIDITAVAAADLPSNVTSVLMKELIDYIEANAKAIVTAGATVTGSDPTATREIEEKVRRYKEKAIGAVNSFGATIVYVNNADKQMFYLMPVTTVAATATPSNNVTASASDINFTYNTIDRPVSFATVITYNQTFVAKIKEQMAALYAKDSLSVSEYIFYTWLEKELELVTTFGREIKDKDSQYLNRYDAEKVQPAAGEGKKE